MKNKTTFFNKLPFTRRLDTHLAKSLLLTKTLEERKLMAAVNFWKRKSKNVCSNVVHSVVLKNYTAN